MVASAKVTVPAPANVATPGAGVVIGHVEVVPDEPDDGEPNLPLLSGSRMGAWVRRDKCGLASFCATSAPTPPFDDGLDGWRG
jgi:hypothetical protein